MHARRLVVTLVLVPVALAAGCGSDGGKEVSRAGGPSATIQGTGYSLQTPDGWTDRTREASQNTSIKPDRLLAGPQKDGFLTNVNVVFEPAPQAKIAEVGAEFAKQVVGIGATNISAVSERELAGDPAITYTYELVDGATRRRARQVAAIHGKRLYTISMTAAASGFADAGKQLESILSSWQWR